MPIGFQPKAKPPPRAPFFRCSCLGQHPARVLEDEQACLRIIAERLQQERPPRTRPGWRFVRSNGWGVDFSFDYGPADAYSVVTNRPELIQQLTSLLVGRVDAPVRPEAGSAGGLLSGSELDWPVIRASWDYVMLGRERDWTKADFTRPVHYGQRMNPAPSPAYERLAVRYQELYTLYAGSWGPGRDCEEMLLDIDEIKRQIWAERHQQARSTPAVQLAFFTDLPSQQAA